LNTVDIGYWLESIFHKNDGYQTPLVINPKRDEGSIDIEKEKELQKAKLLVNTLDILSANNKADALFNEKLISKVVFINSPLLNQFQEKKQVHTIIIIITLCPHIKVIPCV
jgi:hypothetical protein